VRRRGLVFLILLLAFGLRMVHLQSRPFWYDEAFAVLYASLSPARIVHGTVTPVEGAGAADVHPLLYYALLHRWIGLAGRTPLAVRFLSVGLGMVTVVLLWRLAAWCFDRQTGLVVGVLAAANPFHVAYSQESRMYALLGLTAVTTALGLLQALEAERGSGEREARGGMARDCRRFAIACSLAGRWKWWALYTTAAALTLYAHNLGGAILLALNLLAVARRRWWAALPSLFLADLVALGFFGPWLAGVLPGQVGFLGRGYWLTPPGVEEWVRATMLPILTFYEPAPAWLLGLGLFVSLALLALLVLQVWRVRSRAGWFLLLCWVPIIALVSVSRWRPVYLERALLPSALFYLVAVGWLLARGGLPRSLRLGLAALLLAATAGSLGVHYTYAGFPRPPFQEAVAYLRNHIGSTDVVVHTNKLTYFPMHVYGPDVPGVFLADPVGSPQDTLALPTQEALGIFATPGIAEGVGEAERVWLVYFPREMEEMGVSQGEHPALAWLEGRFVQVGQEHFSDLIVSLYRREDP
jgi:mannosyltransferase